MSAQYSSQQKRNNSQQLHQMQTIQCFSVLTLMIGAAVMALRHIYSADTAIPKDCI